MAEEHQRDRVDFSRLTAGSARLTTGSARLTTASAQVSSNTGQLQIPGDRLRRAPAAGLHDPRCCIQPPTASKAGDPRRRPAGVLAASRWRRSGARSRPRAKSDSPRAPSGSPASRRVGADVLQPSHHVADLVDPRPEQLRAWRDAPLAECPARISTQGASTGRNRCSSAARGSAPTIRSTSLPSRITTSNGIDCAPNLEASPGFVSTSTFTTFRCPA
jgi:hypothetical protein